MIAKVRRRAISSGREAMNPVRQLRGISLYMLRHARIASDRPRLRFSCHCERSEAISMVQTHPDRDCFVAPLLAMTIR
jgi:hypothetical protein